MPKERLLDARAKNDSPVIARDCFRRNLPLRIQRAVTIEFPVNPGRRVEHVDIWIGHRKIQQGNSLFCVRAIKILELDSRVQLVFHDAVFEAQDASARRSDADRHGEIGSESGNCGEEEEKYLFHGGPTCNSSRILFLYILQLLLKVFCWLLL